VRHVASPSAHAAAHIAALCGFAVAQPLFDLLGRNPTFFVAHQAGAVDLVLFALVLAVGPPLVVLLPVAALGTSTRRGHAALLVAVAALAALVALPPLNRAGRLPAGAVLAGAAATGALGALGYARVAAARSLLTALTPAALVFLLHSPASRLLGAEEETTMPADVRATPPMVFVVFDGLAMTALLDGAGAVDAVRYPAFARLAATATWYRDTTTVADLTQNAIPAILTGRYPRPSLLVPTVVDHPRNLFTLLAGHYDMDVHEILTQLCPARLCATASEATATKLGSMAADAAVVYAHLVLPASLRPRLPSIDERWRDFGADAEFHPKARAAMQADRAEAFERFVAGIRPRPRPTLHFIHTLLPHAPFAYLPTGRRYGAPFELAGLVNAGWYGNQTAAETAERRYLLQVGFVDRLLGHLLDRLEETGMLDSVLLVVTADHGCSFMPEQPLRALSVPNYYEIAPVPLFIKAPGQRAGRVHDAPLETVDVVPTVAALLGVQLADTDGRSALEAIRRERRTFVLRSGSTWPARSSLAVRDQAVASRIARLGARTGWEALVARGPRAELVGAAAGGMVAPELAPYGLRLWSGFSPEMHEGGPVPAYVEGALVPREAAGPAIRTVAIAVNGVIGATARAVGRPGAPLAFQALVADGLLRPGTNRFDVFVVDDGDPARPRLARVPPQE
jgi:hypothetical protein